MRINTHIIFHFYFYLMMPTQSIPIWEYIKELKLKHVYKNKQLKFLSHLVIYTNNLQVYKIAVFANPNRKNGWRYGVNDMVKIHTPDTNKHISFPKLTKEIDGSDVGRKMFIWHFRDNDVKCYDGEQEQ